jgi:hypothetical protein
LRRFAAAITILNLFGHTFLGFEQSWAQPLVALGTAYTVELLLEIVDARARHRRPGFLRGGTSFIDFLLPTHITGLACAMLLYANDRLLPVAFAAAVAVGSKAIFRAPVGPGERHFLNPSNTGIACTLLAFPSVGVAQPYQFTENVSGLWDWIVPGIIVCTGTFINGRFTRKLPLIGGWLGGFALQATARSLWFGTPVAAALGPMTGMAFLLFTFYMVTDPATTPEEPRTQVAFGAGVAAAYSVLQVVHVVFGLFFALCAVCALRGVALYVAAARRAQASELAEPRLALEAAER